MTGKKYLAIFIIFFTLLITYLHYSTFKEAHALHDIYREFYYIPILLAALAFGLKGAVLTFLFIFVLYLPYAFASWTGAFASEANKLLHLLLQGLLAFFGGFLIDLNRKRTEQLERERYLAGIGRAAATIAHDLKTPLITILGFAKRIREGKAETDEGIRTIMDSAQNMQKIVHEVLDFSKPVKMNLKEEDMRDVVAKACDSCKTKAEKEGVILSTKLPLAPLNAKTDGFHMERALANIIANSIEASGKGDDIKVELLHEKGKAVIKVKDNGSGMDKQTLENIFDPFYTTKNSGTGLGMSIAKKIIEGHGGKIHVSSRHGLGTEVRIELPREK